MNILVINAGSSTFKFALYHLEDGGSQTTPQEPTWQNTLDFGSQEPVDLSHQIEEILKPILEANDIQIVGHRVVHGGSRYSQPVLITDEVKKEIAQLSGIAPLHNPANLRGIEIISALLPQAKQVAVFDTAFHQTLPAAASTYPIPENWRAMGIRRYGFHGISHDYCSKRAATLLGSVPANTVSCHLGNGSSLAAITSGMCVDTTMGFTPLEGVMMGTRCGSIDPGILLYLQREHELTWKEIETALNDESGFKGVCGTSDLRMVLELKKEGSTQAILAYDLFIHSLCRHVGAMVGSLGSLDVLIFTGGIGENAVDVRGDVCKRLKFFGIDLDEGKNANRPIDMDVSTQSSRVKVLVIHTREDFAIAQACLKLK